MALPRFRLQDVLHLVECKPALLLAVKEVRRDADSSARAVVDRNIAREQFLGDQLTVFHVDRHRPAPPRRVLRRVRPPATLFRALVQKRASSPSTFRGRRERRSRCGCRDRAPRRRGRRSAAFRSRSGRRRRASASAAPRTKTGPDAPSNRSRRGVHSRRQVRIDVEVDVSGTAAKPLEASADRTRRRPDFRHLDRATPADWNTSSRSSAPASRQRAATASASLMTRS